MHGFALVKSGCSVGGQALVLNGIWFGNGICRIIYMDCYGCGGCWRILCVCVVGVVTEQDIG